MGFDIVRGVVSKPKETKILADKISSIMEKTKDTGTLYLGYPLTASYDSKVTIDALLVSEKKGVIAFILGNLKDSVDILKEVQDSLYYHLDFYFKKYNSLRKGRNLAFTPIVITMLASLKDYTKDDSYYFAEESNIDKIIESIPAFDGKFYTNVCESLQKVTNIRPQKKRLNVTSKDSLGYIIKEIEKEIANLDEWQKKAALEVPDGPQRIRGLAGTGKTIVLALKAAYLHTQHPDWNIAITYYTRSLKQQYEELVKKFVFDFSGEDPDWDKIEIMHSWGSKKENGVYYYLTRKVNVTPYTLTSAIEKFGRNNPFRGMCDELLQLFKGNVGTPMYDAILIDEAQDMPSSFFRLIYEDLKEPKRLIWAYDELQNLSEMEMPSLLEMFGADDNGELRINITNEQDEPQRDIILPICYRNPPWTLATAHALGFGLYNNKNKLPIQMFDNPKLWKEIGYAVVDGRLDYGRNVTLERKNLATPEYFESFLKDKDSISFNSFKSKDEQYSWVAKEIFKNISEDELDADDILVVFPDVISAKSEYVSFSKYLQRFNVGSVLAGVNTDRDIFRIPDNVTCSGIYRAKGNESPMVYLVNADYCSDGAELIRLRNILFTAITRSRAWVRICGSGEILKSLEKEFKNCEDNGYKLKFKIPNKKEMEKIRKLNRERTEEERVIASRAKGNIDDLIGLIERGEIDIDMLPELDTLINVIKKKS